MQTIVQPRYQSSPHKNNPAEALNLAQKFTFKAA